MNKENIIGIVCNLYEELEISDLGFDLEIVCNKLEINLKPYSSFENKFILLRFDEDGFNCINPIKNSVEIYYNDEIYPHQRLKFTIPHEIGHIVLNHNLDLKSETNIQKKEADIFASEFYCPEALIIHYNLRTELDLMSTFGITLSYAKVLIDRVNNRTKNLSCKEKRLVKIFEKNKLKKSNKKTSL